MINKPKLYILTGPTASGKTAVSIDCALQMNGEIISADAIQVYSGLNIGSAKPTVEERRGVPHHLIDVADPMEGGFSVSRFRALAFNAAWDIHSRGKTPVVVGGTGLYINALTYPLAFSGAPPNVAFRDKINEIERKEKGAAHRLLAEKDPETAKRLHPNDVKRVVRALEIIEATGKELSASSPGFTARDDEALPFAPVMAALSMPRELLYERIDARVDAMFKAGLVEEVKTLLTNGCEATLPAMQGLGYKETAAYLQGQCSLADAIETIKRETRRFAKRQLTWFRREERIRWFDITQYSTAQALADAITQYFITGREGATHGE